MDQETLKHAFETHPEADRFFSTSDGTLFHKKHEAGNHAKSLKDKKITLHYKGGVDHPVDVGDAYLEFPDQVEGMKLSYPDHKKQPEAGVPVHTPVKEEPEAAATGLIAGHTPYINSGTPDLQKQDNGGDPELTKAEDESGAEKPETVTEPAGLMAGHTPYINSGTAEEQKADTGREPDLGLVHSAEKTSEAPEQNERAQLVELYTQRLGKKPANFLSIEKLKAAIAAAKKSEI